MSSPELTIVVPAYNGARFLPACLASLARQRYRDLECILVDDGSTDDTARIFHAHAARDARLRYVHQRNAGLSAARNTGIAHARGRWLAFMDCDDCYLPGGIDALLALRGRGTHVLAGLLAGTRIGRRRRPVRVREVDAFLSTLRLDPTTPPLYVTATFVRRDLVERVGGFSTAYPGAEDRDFLCRVAARAAVASTTRAVSFYREGHAVGLDEQSIASGRTLASLQRLYRSVPRRREVVVRARPAFARMRASYLHMLHAAETLPASPAIAAAHLARAARGCATAAELVSLVDDLGGFFRLPKARPARAARRHAAAFRALHDALPVSEDALRWLLANRARRAEASA